MDDAHRSAFARVLSDHLTRRRLVVMLAGVAGLPLSQIAAKRRKGGRKKKRHQAERHLRAATAGPQPITIVTEGEVGANGTFTATGAIDDTGTFAQESVNFSAAGAPTFFIVHVTFVFTGTQGTFTLRSQDKLTLTTPPQFPDSTGEGTWVILGGTGAYATLHGQGTVAGGIDENEEPSHQFTYTGVAHFA